MLTFASYLAFEFQSATLAAGLGLFALAMVKVDLLIGNFMHLRWPHRPFRQVLLGWWLVVLLILAGGVSLLPWETSNV